MGTGRNVESVTVSSTKSPKRSGATGFSRPSAVRAGSPCVVVLLIVGGAACNEWRKARETAAAQALGDAVMRRCRQPEGGARAECAGAIGRRGAGRGAVQPSRRGRDASADEREAAATPPLDAVAAKQALRPRYRQLATAQAGAGRARASRSRRNAIERLEPLTEPARPTGCWRWSRWLWPRRDG